MASEQTGVKKKKSVKSLAREEICGPILYRHQDCIPSAKLLQNCEKLNIAAGVKTKPGQDCCARLNESKAEPKDTRNNSTKPIVKVKKNGTAESNSQNDDVKDKNINGTDGGQEQILSRAWKRRLRYKKQKESLITSANNVEPSLPVQSNTNIQPSVSSVSPHTNNLRACVTLPTSSSTLRPTKEPIKTNVKDSRKRLDKSGSRSKSLKSKPLSEQTNQTKANIIKTLEEKTLSSLLQTLAPFANTSPKREKPSPIKSPFSFPEKRLPISENKVGKDGVFYFGETKNQLETLNLEPKRFTPETSPILAKEKTDSALRAKPAKSIHTNKNQGNLPINVPKFNFFSASQDLSQNHINLEVQTTPSSVVPTLPQTVEYTNNPATTNPILENKTYELGNGLSFPEHFLSQKELKELQLLLQSHALTHLEKQSNTDVEKLTENVTQSENSSVEPHPKETCMKVEPQPKMKSEDQTNKTREEVLKEREAKKAAKLAAKAKKTDKNNKETKDVVKNKSDSSVKDGNKIVVENVSKEPEISPKVVENKDVNSEVKAITEKISDVKLENTKDQPSAKSKADLRAERRAKQEAQRAAKLAEKETKVQVKEKPAAQTKKDPKPVPVSAQSPKKLEVAKPSAQPKPKLFSHLYQEKIPLISNEILKGGGVHPAVIRLGVQYSTRVVVGSNARCVALLNALKQVIEDYETPAEKEFSRGLEEELGCVSTYLNQCRPMAVSMTNALRHIKRSLTQLPNNISDKEARSKLCDMIDQYIHEQIDVAAKQICNTVREKISDGDVVLTYGCSSLVYQILVESHQKGAKFRVVIVDGRPWFEGREMLRRLVNKGLSCTYVLITAASFIMREATKVLLGAHALLANGYVMSRAGSSQVALLAHCNNVPVLVCCETHKFSERVQTDAFVYNELGELPCESVKDGLPRLTALSLAYDITPPDLVSAVVTEVAVLPCTSVPVILRIKPSESVI